MPTILINCPGCQRKIAWVPGYSVKEVNGVITFIDRDNVNCRLYERGK